MDISNKAVVEFIAKTDSFRIELAKLKSSLQGIQKPASDSFSKIGQTANVVGKAMTKYVTAPLVGAGALALREFGSYEHALNGVGKTMNISGKELQGMGKKFQIMGRTVPIATNELLEIASAGAQLGVGAQDIESFTKTIADMGLATDLSTDQAAMGMAQFMASMGKTSATTKNYNEDVSRLGSTIVAMGNKFATGETAILEMGQRLVGTAHSIGMNESGVMALSTAMSALGINAQQGGGAMSRVMRKINTAVLSNSADVEKFAKVAGMSATEFANTWKKDPIQAINKFVGGLDDVQKSGGDMAGLLAELGIKGSQEVDVLSRLAGGHQTLSQAIEQASKAWESNSALSEEAKVRYGELKGSIQKFKNAISELGSSFGEFLSGQFKSFLDGLTKLINKFNDLGEGPKKVIMVIAEVVAAIGPALLIIAKLISTFKKLKTALTIVKGGFTAFTTVMSGPVGMILMIIGSLVLLGVALYKHRDQIVEFAKTVAEKFLAMKDKVVEVFSNIKTAIGEAIENIKTTISEKFTAIKEFFTTLWESIKTGISEAWTSIHETLTTIITAIVTGVTEAWSGFVEMLANVWETVKTGVSTAWTTIGEIFSTVVQTIITTITNIWNGFISIITSIWESIKTVAQGVWEGIKTTISNLVQGAITVITSLWDSYTSYISNVWNAILNVAQSVWNTIKSVISSLVKGAVNVIKNLWNSYKSYINNTWNAILNIGKSVFNAIASVVTNLSNRAKSAISNAWNSAKNIVVNLVNNIKSTVSNGFSNLVSTVRNKGSQIVSGVRNAFNNAVNAARTFISRAVSIGRNLILGFVNGVKQKANALIGAVKNAVGGAINFAKGLLGIGSPSKLFKKFARWTLEGYEIGIKKEQNSPIKAMKNATNGIIDAFNPINQLSLPSIMSSSVNAEITHRLALNTNQPQPMNLNIAWGRRDYYAQVNDITETQDKDVELKERYGFNV